MSRKKIFIASFMLLFLLLVGSTMAYLTDTDYEVNVFTFGNVSIDLTEPHWVAADGLNIIPGQTLPKDPKITNTGTTNAYVMMEVRVPCIDNTPIFTYSLNAGWTPQYAEHLTCYGGATQGIYYYGTSSIMTNLAPNASTPTLFDSVTVASLNTTQVNSLQSELEIEIIARAVQADGDNTGNGHSNSWNDISYVFYPIG